MKKITQIILTISIAACLTACDNNEKKNDTSNDSVQNSSSNSTSSIENSSSSENSTTESTSINSNEDSNSNHEMSIEELIDAFTLDSFTAPDGNTVNKSEAFDAYYDEDFKVTSSIGFDFSYIRYAKPIFHNTIDEPDLVNWDTLDFKVDINMPIEDPGTFKVKAGDKLKNGLTVKSAEFHVGSYGEIFQNRIELSGELTLEGILYRAPEDGYNVSTDDLTFFADPTKCDFPIAPLEVSEYLYRYADTQAEFAMVGDATLIRLGNYNTTSVDLSGIINRGEYVKVKITVKDIYLLYYEGPGNRTSATLVSVDKIR